MKKKEFSGWIDGHYVTGTYVEKDDQDCEREIEESGKALWTTVKVVAGIALGVAVLAALGSGRKQLE